MAGAVLSGTNTAGGVISGPSHVTLNGVPWAVVGASVADHGDGAHNAATIAAGAGHVRIGGQTALLAGDAATCGHVATGTGHVEVS